MILGVGEEYTAGRGEPVEEKSPKTLTCGIARRRHSIGIEPSNVESEELA